MNPKIQIRVTAAPAPQSKDSKEREAARAKASARKDRISLFTAVVGICIGVVNSAWIGVKFWIEKSDSKKRYEASQALTDKRFLRLAIQINCDFRANLLTRAIIHKDKILS